MILGTKDLSGGLSCSLIVAKFLSSKSFPLRVWLGGLCSIDVQRLVTSLSPKYGSAGSTFLSVNMDCIITSLFRSHIMREISAASTAVNTKVSLYIRRALILLVRTSPSSERYRQQRC